MPWHRTLKAYSWLANRAIRPSVPPSSAKYCATTSTSASSSLKRRCLFCDLVQFQQHVHYGWESIANDRRGLFRLKPLNFSNAFFFLWFLFACTGIAHAVPISLLKHHLALHGISMVGIAYLFAYSAHFDACLLYFFVVVVV